MTRRPTRHRKTRLARLRNRHTFRLGLLATACLGAIGTAAGAAQAVGAGAGLSGVAVADDISTSLANPGHQNRFDDSFAVHQFGTVYAGSVRNQATAESVACTADNPCRSVSISFQIDTLAGENVHLNAVNLSNADNEHCDGCQTLASAYQFVVSTPAPFALSPAAQSQLAAIHAQLDALSTSTAPVAQVQAQIDALAGQVTTILQTAAANAPAVAAGPTTNAPMFQPTVTVHRMFNQN